MAPTAAAMNPILIEIMQNAFALIAEEMGVTLQRTSYSTNIKDRLDFSCALYTREGLLVAQAEHIPLHLGQMTAGVKNLLNALKVPLAPGDVYMVNDPTVTGAHFPDILMAKGVFREGELIGIVANLAHHVDVGGFAPGSLYSGATEAFQEGIRIPPTRLVRGGELQQEILNFFLSNTRTERENRGDCLAQIAALAAGERKLDELATRNGTGMVTAAMAEVIAYAERRIRAAMDGLPVADASFTDFIEGDGCTDDQIPITVRVTSAPGRMTFDFAGTSPQVRGPINATFPFTLACVAFCVKSILDPTTPANEGMFAPLEVRVPEGSILNARFPAAMSNNSSILGLRIVDAIFGALSSIFPNAITAASSGTMNVVTIGGFDPHRGERFAYIESYGGGQGGACLLDGMDGVHTTTSNTRNASAEVIEHYYPIVVTRYGLVEDSGGRGEYRGGLGLFREFEFRTETTFSLVSDRRARRPWGLFGGEDGAASCCVLTLPDGEQETLPPKVTRSVPAGSRLYLATAGGGGYGLPKDRHTDRIAADRRNGLMD
jgi:N-methylhydantoinase B